MNECSKEMKAPKDRVEIDETIEKLINWEKTAKAVKATERANLANTPLNTFLSVQNQFKTVTDSSVDAEEERLLGNEAAKQKDYERALLHYNRSLELHVNSSACYANRALMHLKLGDAKKALNDAIEALSYDPKNVKAYHRKGIALMQQGAYKDAAKAFHDGLKVNPHQREIQASLQAILRESKEKTTISDEDVNLSTLLFSENILPTYHPLQLQTETEAKSLSSSCMMEEEFSASLPSLVEKQEIVLSIQQLKEKGNSAFSRREFIDAIHFFTEAIRLIEKASLGVENPSLLSILLSNRSQALLQCNRWASAAVDARSAVRTDVKNLKAHFRLAVALSHFIEDRSLLDKAHVSIRFLKTEYKKKGSIPQTVLNLESSLLKNEARFEQSNKL
ncbi:hypothetical protein IE077_002011 [Cardiosporidium cionae]|uniref:Uncharacterized protein n=1 Tax=Cardiosporidium cionae TaxID=476202 RepID=A0ABQ7JBS4_9APIC|nr:hypothetical protein IE077_002011 [Cardiosporidium cionae]|eukprot:KAF8821458.1 hypothetical protein IE077_002011 [Cardiosporidium cionae]